MPRHDRLDLARVLLARAVDDETLVRKVSSDTDIADAIVGFHAQQAAEKLRRRVESLRWRDAHRPPDVRQSVVQ
jgi:hypothetical protein